MRAIISKVLTGSMVAGAALMVSACGGGNESTATENTTVTDLNATEGMDTMSDNMTAVDGATNTGMMSNDSMMMSNDSTMMANDSMSTTTNTTTTTTNAM